MSHTIKIETQYEWESIRNKPSHYFREVIALYVDNTFDKFLIDYDFISNIAQSTKHGGFCDLHINDVNHDLNDLYSLRDMFISQIHINSPGITLSGTEYIKDFSSFVFLSEQNIDLSYLKAHQDRPVFSLAIKGKSLSHLESLINFPDFEYLCLDGSISDCNVFKQFNSFKDRCRTELYLDNNLIETLECFEDIFLCGLSLNQNRVKDISNLSAIINHNLKQCNHFFLSLLNNPIETKEYLALMQQNDIQQLIKERSLVLDF